MSTAQRDVVEPFRWCEVGEIRWLAADLGHAQAAFSGRTGGVSKGPYNSLNLGMPTDDEPTLVRQNRRLLAEALGRDLAGLAVGRQVHGTAIEVRDARPATDASLAEADAQLALSEEATPLVLVADCVPLALAGAGAVAMVHCGWRGLAGGIVERAVATLSERAPSEPAAMRAAIGPGIGSCCYEVGGEVAEVFASSGPTLDLPAIVRTRLRQAGLPTTAIVTSGLCTSCNRGLFFSHRRDRGVTGRQAGLAWLR
ncbi:MAG: polyphenol oxidase family protein [Solirubrobacterales bacterium]